MTLTCHPIVGLPHVRPGDDLAALLVDALTSPHVPALADGDVVVVTSKVVSKSEGRVVRSDDRDAVIDAQTSRVVASWTTHAGRTVIAETGHGLVLAAAGVDASNTEPGTLVLLPVDPDASARRLRAAMAELLDVNVAVVVSDTMGRPWRQGQTDSAIGAAGLTVLDDRRGTLDAYGNRLEVTVRAVADEIAGAAELVASKTSQVPAVVVRGLDALVLPPGEDGPGAAALVRPAEQDRFRLGTDEAMAASVHRRRTVRTFAERPVPLDALRRAVQAAMTAPAPHHTRPWRFVRVVDPARTRLLDAMRQAWIDDLSRDGVDQAAIERRTGRGEVLRRAPEVVVPCLVTDGRHDYPDARRDTAESVMYWLAMGAGVQNMLVSLASEGIGTAWVSSTLFCPDVVRDCLGLPEEWLPAGAVAIGYPDRPVPSRAPSSTDGVWVETLAQTYADPR